MMIQILSLILGACYCTMIVEGRSCPVGEIPVQKLDVQLESNGCTKPAFLTVNGEEDFTHCCDRHDACFSTCGVTQKFCDDDFLKCMNNLCDTVFPANKECKSAATTYSMGTSIFGTEPFSQGQKDHCQCIPTENLVDHYKTYAGKFYSKYVPVAQAKDPNDIFTEKSKYLKNSGTELIPQYKSIYKIVYDLHKKFDNAIGHIESRQGKKSVPTPHAKKQEL
jgi:secretory phospholipase A2